MSNTDNIMSFQQEGTDPVRGKVFRAYCGNARTAYSFNSADHPSRDRWSIYKDGTHGPVERFTGKPTGVLSLIDLLVNGEFVSGYDDDSDAGHTEPESVLPDPVQLLQRPHDVRVCSLFYEYLQRNSDEFSAMPLGEALRGFLGENES